jgi:EAL domain-containing protein (putative c-di-GMP-specific phosphodiesterase class I)
MGLRVIAEGVEDGESLRMLRDFGCDMVQGYFVSRPLPGADFLAWIRDSPWGRGAGFGPSAA